MRFSRPLLLVTASLLASAGHTAAHDIPSDATVQLFAKPSGARLQLLVRVPLRIIRDFNFPERPGGYLDMEKLAPLLSDATKLWIADFVEIHEGDTRLPPPRLAATQISLESDRSFASFEEALAHVTGPHLATDANVVWNQVMLDALLEYPIQSDRSRFSIRPGLERLAARVVTVLRFQPPDGPVRAFEFTADPGLVPMDPGWLQAALRFVKLGFFHILDGTDHLLFLLCLVIPLRSWRPLVLVVTAFTIAHSFTLIAAAYNVVPDALWFPPLIETLIAVSIVYMALENIAVPVPQRRWMMAFAFGLVHGFGFSFALRETLQFAGSHLLTSLLSFNIGVELGQLLVLILLIPALTALFRFAVAERMGIIILSALVAHTGWHWMLERAAILSRFQRPTFDAASIAGAMRWLMAVLVLSALVGLIRRQFWTDPRPALPEPRETT
ncbi:MAG: HupE/UreJ family protein [Bryobacteraceae bacterium]